MECTCNTLLVIGGGATYPPNSTSADGEVFQASCIRLFFEILVDILDSSRFYANNSLGKGIRNPT